MIIGVKQCLTALKILVFKFLKYFIIIYGFKNIIILLEKLSVIKKNQKVNWVLKNGHFKNVQK
jgi:hypothetical protein